MKNPSKRSAIEHATVIKYLAKRLVFFYIQQFFFDWHKGCTSEITTMWHWDQLPYIPLL
jgi:hypothetical protein